MTKANDLTYSVDDTFEDLYDKLNNKYLNPLTTSNLILAKAIREATEFFCREEVQESKVIYGDFGGDDLDPGA